MDTGKRILIGFCGRQHSGKSCAAKFLRNKYGASIVTIASPLKDIAVELMKIYEEDPEYDRVYLDIDKDSGRILEGFCFTEPMIDVITTYTGIKNISLSVFSSTITNVRTLLQFLGTEIIREYNPQWHVERMVARINTLKDAGVEIIAVDDIRYPNEREAVETMGGKVLFVSRDMMDYSYGTTHSSEVSITEGDFNDDDIIVNDGTIDEFLKKVDAIVRRCS